MTTNVAVRPVILADEEASYVYFAQRSDGLVKIGRSRTPLNRLRCLSYEHGPLTLLGVRRGSYALEWDLHWRFREHRDSEAGGREWFRPCSALLAYAGQFDLKTVPATSDYRPEVRNETARRAIESMRLPS